MIAARNVPSAESGSPGAFDLAHWQLNEVIYVRPVATTQGPAFSVHAADGTPLFVAGSMNQVMEAARENEVRLATLH
ncbi:MAG: DUF1150 domain-containing protein [Magnetospirillum sp. WYHS-4]